jgi:hypothetical protein
MFVRDIALEGKSILFVGTLEAGPESIENRSQALQCSTSTIAGWAARSPLPHIRTASTGSIP